MEGNIHHIIHRRLARNHLYHTYRQLFFTAASISREGPISRLPLELVRYICLI
ncbi:hypothetical protein H696_01190 [Fonticula alba]|uniref:Uncharacterized protein n=1 Tax=Fonticula alba TaxID=691883 RepID=A0A058ZE85_FONAL|nr:hypothetical protein H696_01190 [Fonticula alba]KCV71772.1 hypothetical protein H696_01190 [Fonticula alba]|eukprot:XP_009493350.1 hypothetical protein H696_01190 [Fonticula alba]